MIERLSPPVDPVIAIETRGMAVNCETARLSRVLARVLRRHHITTTARVRLSVQGADGLALAQANVRFLDAPTRVQISGPRGFVAGFAAERLETDPRGRRGRLMYRRYDGDLAVVIPAASESRGAAKGLS
ncbi:hypothetical protein ACFZC5_29795 [Nocardia gamkensis]|uniref:hypothetical protein n=1 Tax=Nocardia gamkensis TaxID=352869 RepID=UPI0036E2AF1E